MATGSDLFRNVALPLFLTVPEVAELLRTSPKAIYAMVERGQLPGVYRLGRRVLVKRAELLDFRDHNHRAPSPQENRR
jgi:excisionase family DNA binding protein